MITGTVFDIQRFALHDGPGIRTTVFLKGCPLNCIWCHNPESIRPDLQLSYNAEKCAQCGACVRACPTRVHTVWPGGHTVDFTRCCLNGRCVTACAYGALTIVGKSMTVDTVMAEVIKDRDYYASSQGGLTLSGGEPMRQFAFTKALLSRAKTTGIHTCLDTCGYAPAERYKEIMPLVDLFLYDYKATDPAEHQRLTGVDNKLIRSNLAMLMQLKATIVLRCPIVPSVNDSDIHLKSIADLSNEYPDLAIEIMAYHDMGRGKRERIGAAPAMADRATAPSETKTEWMKRLETFGCRNCSMG